MLPRSLIAAGSASFWAGRGQCCTAVSGENDGQACCLHVMRQGFVAWLALETRSQRQQQRRRGEMLRRSRGCALKVGFNSSSRSGSGQKVSLGSELRRLLQLRASASGRALVVDASSLRSAAQCASRPLLQNAWLLRFHVQLLYSRMGVVVVTGCWRASAFAGDRLGA